MRFGFVILALAWVLIDGTARADGSDEDAQESSENAESTGKKAEVAKSGLVGMDLPLVIPVSDMAKLTGPQFGLLLRAGGVIVPSLQFIARVGYLAGTDKSTSASGAFSSQTETVTLDTNIANIPLWAGIRYFLLTNESTGLFVAADIAFNILIFNATVSAASGGVQNGNSSHDTQARAGINAGIGYVFSRAMPIDIQAQFSYFNLLFADSGETGLGGVGLSVGYSLFL